MRQGQIKKALTYFERSFIMYKGKPKRIVVKSKQGREIIVFVTKCGRGWNVVHIAQRQNGDILGYLDKAMNINAWRIQQHDFKYEAEGRGALKKVVQALVNNCTEQQLFATRSIHRYRRKNPPKLRKEDDYARRIK